MAGGNSRRRREPPGDSREVSFERAGLRLSRGRPLRRVAGRRAGGRQQGGRRRGPAPARPDRRRHRRQAQRPQRGRAARPRPRRQAARDHGHGASAGDDDRQRPVAAAGPLRARGPGDLAQAEEGDRGGARRHRGRPGPVAGDGQAPADLQRALRLDGARRRDRRQPRGGAGARRGAAGEGRPPAPDGPLRDGLPEPDRGLRGRGAGRHGRVPDPDLRRHLRRPRRRPARP